MAHHEDGEKDSDGLPLMLKELSLSAETTPAQDTASTDPGNMAQGLNLKRGSSSRMNDEVSAAVDDVGDRTGAMSKWHRLHYKKVVRVAGMYGAFKFMGLPYEVRNMIYEATLTRPDGRFFIGTKQCTRLCRSRAVLGISQIPFWPLSETPSELARSTRNPAILRASKTIYAEAGVILYGQEFIFAELAALQCFLAGLRQPQIALLQHVEIAEDPFGQHTHHRAFMPGVFSLLAGADGLETLRIPDIRRLRAQPFNLFDGVHRVDDTTTFAEWDAVVARNLAAEVYCRLFTYLREAVAVRGIDEVMKVLVVFEEFFRRGTDHMGIPWRPAQVLGFPWTADREAAMKRAMGQEIERLLEADNM